MNEVDKVTIRNQSNPNNDIEKVQLSNGDYLTSSDINLIIQEMTTFSSDNGVALSNMEDVRANQNFMTIIVNSWQPA
ncbi:MAG: hypothetical protein GXP56_17350 [Deltaproteobacteria bacterium]|nr:hypothetical protein [Deltaproteobacteria bacterium]